MKLALVLSQIVVSIALIGLILLQAKGTGLESGAFGGTLSLYSSKRGVERTVFIATIVLAALFGILALILLLV